MMRHLRSSGTPVNGIRNLWLQCWHIVVIVVCVFLFWCVCVCVCICVHGLGNVCVCDVSVCVFVYVHECINVAITECVWPFALYNSLAQLVQLVTTACS